MNETPALKLLTPDGLVPALNPILVKDGHGLELVEKYFKRLAEQPNPEFAADYETNITPTFVDRRARLLALGDKNEQYIIDFLPFAGSTEVLASQQGNFKTPAWAKPIVDVLSPAFDSKVFLKVGQRLGFEYQVSRWNLGLGMWNFYSIDFAERIKWAGLHSFKDPVFYSLASMAARYFGVEMDKSHQTTFDLSSPLTEDDITYSCFDLRVPLAIRAMQLRDLKKDGLERVTQIENDAIGFFEDIHMNGWTTDKVAWGKLVEEWKAKYEDAIKTLDTFFLPIVGSKNVTEQDLDPVLREWKGLTLLSKPEIELKQLIKEAKEKDKKDSLRQFMAGVEKDRKEQAAKARSRYNEVKKKITASKKISKDCEGEAAINYGSNLQVLKALREMKGFNTANLPTTDDKVLEKLKDRPVIAALRDHRTYAKMLETYGEQWTKEYTTVPNAENGWVNSTTHKIHTTILQLEAETGRTSSIKPNAQNLPADKRIRGCFVVDPPNENMRVSNCCEQDTYLVDNQHYYCTVCNLPCSTHAEEYMIVTCDMSGAELRIIAEESGSVSWQTAFNNGWDVHSVGTELLYPAEWPEADQSGQTIQKMDYKTGDKVDYVLPPCSYFNKVYVEKLGREEDHQKCECPKHLEMRDGNKATNFQIAYGGGERALSESLGITEEAAGVLMQKHKMANAEVWKHLEASGKNAVRNRESRSACGRRRLFREPTRETAIAQAKERMFESLKKKNKLTLPNGVKLKLDDMNPEGWQINSARKGMFTSIERRGKNFPIQSLNATIAKLAFGSGFDKNGKPYLWHVIKKYGWEPKNFVHDEIVLQVPLHHAKMALEEVQDCIKRAGAEFFKSITMESEGRIAKMWMK